MINRKNHPLSKNRLLPNLNWYEIDFLTPHSQRKALWGVICLYTGNPLLIDWLARFIDKNDIPERNPMALAKGLQKYAQNNIKYFRESPERFTSPLRTLEWGLGDCDDKSIFLASCLRSFRIPVRLKFLLLHLKNGDKAHVYPLAKLNNNWYPIESVIKLKLGIDPELLINKKGISTTANIIGDKG